MSQTERRADLAGQVAIVTGAGRRVGRVIATSLAGLGCDVILHFGRSRGAAEETARQIEAIGRRAVLVEADLREAVAASERIVEAAAKLGGASILVNNAAIFEDAVGGQTSEELFDRHLDINLKAPFFLCQAFSEQIPDGTAGQILNLVDWRSVRPGGDYLAYTLSKAGLLAMTRTLAQRLAPGIRVNAIAPGAILPPAGEAFDAWQAAKLPEIPLRQTGGPEDVWEAARYLLTSRFVTGEVLFVTGGEEL